MSLKQEIYFNNRNVSNINSQNVNLIWNNIDNPDIEILKKINNTITNPYQIKLNFVTNILNSSEGLPIKTFKDLEKFFLILSPLNIEYNLASNTFNKKIIQNKLFLQNSISKKDASDIFYSKYINKLKNILVKSGIEFNYFEFKSKRFNKTKDIIWVFKLDKLK